MTSTYKTNIILKPIRAEALGAAQACSKGEALITDVEEARVENHPPSLHLDRSTGWIEASTSSAIQVERLLRDTSHGHDWYIDADPTLANLPPANL